MKKLLVMITLFALLLSVSGCKEESIEQQLASWTPVFEDNFDNPGGDYEVVTSPFYQQEVPSVSGVSVVNGATGKAGRLNGYNSYIGYPGELLSPEEGTIRFDWKAPENLLTAYNTLQPDWVGYNNAAPPFSGFMLDTVGWNGAFKGGFSLALDFQEQSETYSALRFGTWSGKAWSYASGEVAPSVWSDGQFHEIIVSWSADQGSLSIYLDGKEIATAEYNIALDPQEAFFIGHNPWLFSNMGYWPYGPHSMMGDYANLRIYDQSLRK